MHMKEVTHREAQDSTVGLGLEICISNAQKSNGNSIKFSLSTWTRRVFKSSRLSYYTSSITYQYIHNLSVYTTYQYIHISM